MSSVVIVGLLNTILKQLVILTGSVSWSLQNCFSYNGFVSKIAIAFPYPAFRILRS